MKNHPHAIFVFALVLAALLTLGCQREAQVPESQPAVEQPAEAAAIETAPVQQAPETAAATEEKAPQAVAAVEQMPQEQPAAPAPAAETPAATAPAVETPVAQAPAAEAAPAPAPVAETPATPAPAADEIAVTVNSTVIMESAIADRVNPRIEQMKKQGMPPEVEQQQRTEQRDAILQGMILEAMLNEKVKEKNIPQATPEQVDAEVATFAKSRSMTIDELAKMLESNGQSLDEMKQYYTKSLTYRNLLREVFADQLSVTDDEAKQFYDTNLARTYTTPERIRASHILIKPDTSDPNADPNTTKAAAKAKAEDLLKQVKEGADFAELAKANSACPSAEKGGDLDFFARGQMVPAFDEAAFALQVGQVSDVVETQFGFHIIKLTDKQAASVKTFDEVKDEIVERVKLQKENQVGGKYVEELRASATIVYPEGKEPKPQGMEIQATPLE
jgi:peptidyl-prolyl cis-trans isomerase C